MRKKIALILALTMAVVSGSSMYTACAEITVEDYTGELPVMGAVDEFGEAQDFEIAEDVDSEPDLFSDASEAGGYEILEDADLADEDLEYLIVDMDEPGGSLVVTDDGSVVYETQRYEESSELSNLPDSDELFAAYVDMLFYPGDELLGAASDRDYKLGETDKKVYQVLRAEIEKIAGGERESTIIDIPLETFGCSVGKLFSASELGVESVVDGNNLSDAAMNKMSEKLEFSLDAVLDALLADYPYHLYWYNKTANTGSPKSMSFTADYDNGEWKIGFAEGTEVSVTMPVSGEFSAEGEEYKVDTEKIQSVHEAVGNAGDLLDSAASLNDTKKLQAYKNYITENVSYNDAAAQNSATPYGNPWQMIWVFDENPDTKVVCEGYSKAFKYLCDQSDFDNPKLECLLARGTMSGGTGAGRHMWNIVRMGERGYLADVTNSDTGTVGYDGSLFMAGTENSDGNGYTISCPSGNISYTYDSDMSAIYDASELQIYSKNYYEDVDEATGEEKNGHSYTTSVVIKEATCAEAGLRSGTCDLCGQTHTEEIPKLEIHTPSDVVRENEVAATCKAEGSYDEVVYCSVCGGEISRTVRTIEKTAHTPSEAVRENEVAATCKAEGSYDEVIYCSVCGEELSRMPKTIAKAAHTPKDAVRENEVAATCKAEGFYEEVVYCNVCGEEISRTPKTIEKIAHTPSEEVKENEVAATCKAEGSYDEVIYCSVCGEEISRMPKTIEKIAHTPSEEVKENEVAATCKAEGSYDEVAYCSVCGEELSRMPKTIAKAAHTPKDAVRENEVAATCKAEGSYDEVIYCSVCGEEISRTPKTIEKAAHTPSEAVRENETATTCTSFYEEVVYCSVCGEEQSRTKVTVKIKDHVWDAGVITKKATLTTTGEKTYTCTKCQDTKTEILPKLTAPKVNITITAKPSIKKPKATAKNKINVTWKKFKVSKKTNALWKKIKKVEIQYSTDKSFSKNVKSTSAKKSKTSVTIKKLTKNTTYYVRIRYTDGKGGYSNWSNTKTVKTKKK